MYPAFALGLLAFLLCLLSTPLCRDLFVRLGIVDEPDGVRKLHIRAVPRVGGLAIAISYSLALALLLAFAPKSLHIAIRHRALLLMLAPSVVLVFLTGLLDDVKRGGLRPRNKLAALTLAAMLAVACGARITTVGGHPAPAWITIPLSVAWLVACSNALNLIDGLDGLAGGVALVATLTTLTAALLRGDVGLVYATAPLAACLLAFLCYNFNPASVFLGDCGSLTIGFVLGCFALIWSQKSATFLGMAAPIMALALPLIDVALAIVRRYLTKQPIFKADRGHIHHRLLARGLRPREAALLLYGVCCIGASISLLHGVVGNRFQGLTAALFCGLAVIGINALGYTEFAVCKQLLSRSTYTRILQERLFTEELIRSMEQAQTLERRWHLLRKTCIELDCAFVRMEFDGRFFSEALHDGVCELPWQMMVSLGRRGSIHLLWASPRATPTHALSALKVFQQYLSRWQPVASETSRELVCD